MRIRTLEMKEISQEDIDRVLELTGQLEDFDILMMYYDCALTQMRTKLEILNIPLSPSNPGSKNLSAFMRNSSCEGFPSLWKI